MPAGGEAEARRFYGELLGLQEISVPESLKQRASIWFGTGSLDLHIGIDPNFTPAKKAHIAYQVDDLEAVERRLRQAGFEIRPDNELPGYRRFYTDDPFGNRVEILKPAG